MKNTKTSKQEKHEHAVVICSIIGRKGVPQYYLNDKKGDHLKFINLRDDFLSEEHLIISRKKKKIRFQISYEEYNEWKKSLENDNTPLDDWKPYKTAGYIYYCPVLGEYDRNNKRVILYTNNIKDLCIRNNNPTVVDEEKKYIVESYVHELFHAFFHYVTLQGKNNYNYIREIEEALTEFCTLLFLKKMKSLDYSSYKRLKEIINFDENEMWKFALQDIKNKQNSLGPLAAYGFGAYLFENLEEEEQYKLINNYIQKLGYIDKDDDKVKEYCEKVRLSGFVRGNQEHCLELLKEILKPTAY